MTDAHAIARSIVWVGVIWALVYGIVKIINGPGGRAIGRWFSGDDDPGAAGDSERLDLLDASLRRLEARLHAVERGTQLREGVDAR